MKRLTLSTIFTGAALLAATSILPVSAEDPQAKHAEAEANVKQAQADAKAADANVKDAKAEAKEAKKELKADEKRKEIDAAEKDAMAMLLKERPSSKELYDKSYGHAVFSNLKIAFMVSGGGGSGVAVEHGSGQRTYMNMGTGGVGLGLGAKKNTLIMLFQTEAAYRKFVDKGWQADTQASAAAGTAGADAASAFKDGMALFQFTEKGLAATADISGTKYWKNDELNR